MAFVSVARSDVPDVTSCDRKPLHGAGDGLVDSRLGFGGVGEHVQAFFGPSSLAFHGSM